MKLSISKHTFMIAIGVIFGSKNSQVLVNAQVYVGCQDLATDDGTAFTSCIYNTPSPFSVVTSSGSTVSFGTASYAYVSCLDGSERSINTCVCNMIVNPSEPIVEADFCSSCDILVVSDTEFSNYFDCSNRLVGDCVGIDATGACISNNSDGGSTPAPADSATTVSPTPAPVDDGTTTASPTPPPVDDGTTTPDDDDELCEGKGKGMMSGKGMKSGGKGDDSDDASGKGKGGKGGNGGKGMMMGKKCKKESKEPKAPKADKSTKEGSRKKRL